MRGWIEEDLQDEILNQLKRFVGM